ncbi:MAG: hypothetical protein D6701_06985 [Gemmatimonadetes bacterium]|nr:MAG: hypothetical protein D6701_06985 [Gemmatimonadota bacterium]
MRFQLTVRFGAPSQRYDVRVVEGDDLRAALRAAAAALPDEVAATADLIELREAPDPDRRPYLEDDEPPSRT